MAREDRAIIQTNLAKQTRFAYKHLASRLLDWQLGLFADPLTARRTTS